MGIPLNFIGIDIKFQYFDTKRYISMKMPNDCLNRYRRKNKRMIDCLNRYRRKTRG